MKSLIPKKRSSASKKKPARSSKLTDLQIERASNFVQRSEMVEALRDLKSDVNRLADELRSSAKDMIAQIEKLMVIDRLNDKACCERSLALIEKQDKRIAALERFRWVLFGCTTAIIFLVELTRPLWSHILL